LPGETSVAPQVGKFASCSELEGLAAGFRFDVLDDLADRPGWAQSRLKELTTKKKR
jgi:hypothetical protein